LIGAKLVIIVPAAVSKLAPFLNKKRRLEKFCKGSSGSSEICGEKRYFTGNRADKQI